MNMEEMIVNFKKDKTVSDEIGKSSRKRDLE